MNLADYYKRQLAWRDWARILDALPLMEGQTVLDIGCGVGDQSALLAERGVRVIGLDINEEIVSAARARAISNAEFRVHDLRSPFEYDVPVDGIWCSFTAAYFVELPAALRTWSAGLHSGGWIALTEIDDFFGHEPVCAETRRALATYADEALAAKRYDFRMGRKLARFSREAGFEVRREFAVEDRELSFSGPADADVVTAWTQRLDGMALLRDHCGHEWKTVHDDFLSCLSRPDHRSVAQVRVCIARK